MHAKFRRPRKSLKRFSSDQALQTREILSLAVLEDPELSQRQLFAALMPEIRALREKGFTFIRITTILNNAGFSLCESTIKTYYANFTKVNKSFAFKPFHGFVE